jgi:hypothetical protein
MVMIFGLLGALSYVIHRHTHTHAVTYAGRSSQEDHDPPPLQLLY